MSIENRIKRIESQVKTRPNSDLCECPNTQRFATILQSSGQEIEKPETEICEKCSKPIIKEFVIIEGVKPAIPKP